MRLVGAELDKSLSTSFLPWLLARCFWNWLWPWKKHKKSWYMPSSWRLLSASVRMYTVNLKWTCVVKIPVDKSHYTRSTRPSPQPSIVPIPDFWGILTKRGWASALCGAGKQVGKKKEDWRKDELGWAIYLWSTRASMNGCVFGLLPEILIRRIVSPTNHIVRRSNPAWDYWVVSNGYPRGSEWGIRQN